MYAWPSPCWKCQMQTCTSSSWEGESGKLSSGIIRLLNLNCSTILAPSSNDAKVMSMARIDSLHNLSLSISLGASLSQLGFRLLDLYHELQVGNDWKTSFYVDKPVFIHSFSASPGNQQILASHWGALAPAVCEYHAWFPFRSKWIGTALKGKKKSLAWREQPREWKISFILVLCGPRSGSPMPYSLQLATRKGCP